VAIFTNWPGDEYGYRGSTVDGTNTAAVMSGSDTVANAFIYLHANFGTTGAEDTPFVFCDRNFDWFGAIYVGGDGTSLLMYWYDNAGNEIDADLGVDISGAEVKLHLVFTGTSVKVYNNGVETYDSGDLTSTTWHFDTETFFLLSGADGYEPIECDLYDFGLWINQTIDPTSGTVQAKFWDGSGDPVAQSLADTEFGQPIIRVRGLATSQKGATNDLSGRGNHLDYVGSFTGAKSFSGTGVASSSVSANFVVVKDFSGSAAGSSTASADLSLANNVDFSCSAAGSSLATANMTKAVVLGFSGTAGAGSNAAASFVVDKFFSGAAEANSSATANMGVVKDFSGSAAGSSIAAASFVVGAFVSLSGSAAGSSSVSASLNIIKFLSCSAAGSSNAFGNISIAGAVNFSGSAAGGSQSSGNISLLWGDIPTPSNPVWSDLDEPNEPGWSNISDPSSPGWSDI